jgi:hypothetical protein
MSAPAGGELAVCPHCWGVNPYAQRLCGGCGADMTLALQESGGLRQTAPAQSPVPVRGAGRLTPLQRLVLLGIVVFLALAQVLAALGRKLPSAGGGGAVERSAPASAVR